MEKRKVYAAVVVIMTMVFCAFAQGPAMINYQGKLVDSNGVPLASGNYDMTFNIYDAETAGSLIFTEDHNTANSNQVAVSGGYFSVILGETTTLYPLYFSSNAELWLEVVATINSGTETFSRTRLVSAPSAMTLVPGASIIQEQNAANLYVGNGSTGLLFILSKRGIWAQTNDGRAIEANASTGTGIYGSATGGVGIHGYSSGNDAIKGEAQTAGKSAVYGVNTAAGGYGVTGRALLGDGVHGYSNSDGKSGVYARSDAAAGFGVTGYGSQNFGVFAWGAGDGSAYDYIGDVLLEGTRGEIFCTGTFFNLYSNSNFNFDLDNDDNTSNAFFYIWNGTDAIVFSVDESGNQTASGTKSAVVQTAKSGKRLLYAMESPEVWFEDIGSGQISGGAAVVAIESIFAETVNLDAGYHVFLTPVDGYAPLFVTNKTASSFEVKDANGSSNVAFDYRIVAKRSGYESLRLAKVIDKSLEEAK